MQKALPQIFGKAVYSLSRISDELWFDPMEKGLALRAVNSSRSAYACIYFSSIFFQSYQERAIHEEGCDDALLHLKCKFPMKSVLPVFRFVSNLGRNVDKCNIYTNFKNCCVVFQLFCKHGLTKTYNLVYLECEPLQAVFNKNTCPNILKIQSRILSDVLIHFPTCQEELTLSVTPLKVSLKTYIEEDIDFSKAMHTEIHLSPDEFDYFQVGVDSEVTFCLKEFRGLLALAEATNNHISVYFSKPGKPVAFSIDDKLLEANFILATLSESESKAVSQSSLRLSLRSSLCAPNMDADKENTIRVSTQENTEVSQNRVKNMCSASPTLLTAYRNASNMYQMMEEERHEHSDYNKFCTLFFGAISSQLQPNTDQTSHCLATASEDEEDNYCVGLSQTF
ncbi:cell cycle checkpoint control protein RAD9B [Bombina bombina]|uniref:cell cycle checkpoint control protein RAD9B n=1 Tax=Bombina bombina TaxID=8345 RepID=UPI00235B0979|nr:cell cycle checkpoint control protein RAD9B [Bombina bombina]